MRHIISLVIFCFILYYHSDIFVSDLLTPSKRSIIEKHIKKRTGLSYKEKRKLLADINPTYLGNNPENYKEDKESRLYESLQHAEDASWDECQFHVYGTRTKALEDRQTQIGFVCDLKPRTLHSAKEGLEKKEHYSENHYTLIMEAPVWTDIRWITHVVNISTNIMMVNSGIAFKTKVRGISDDF